MTEFYDDFEGHPDSALAGLVSPSGHTWSVVNADTFEVVDGRLVSTEASNPPGSYGQVTLDAKPTKMTARVSWLGVTDDTDDAAVVLMASADPTPQGAVGSQGPGTDFTHAVFGRKTFSVNYYEGNVASAYLSSYTYAVPCLADGTIYEISVEYRQGVLVCTLPDGTVRRGFDPKVRKVTGPTITYQVYRTLTPDLYPRIESVTATTDPLPVQTGDGLGW